MVTGTSTVLEPTFTGYVATTMDALILFEACLSGLLHHVPRRPHDRERSHLVRSGSVFIYEENSSGIKRWTDGVTWSPSRILGNFLVYRELEKPFPPGEKKRAMKKTTRRTPGPPGRPGEPYPRQDSTNGYSPSPTEPYGERSHPADVQRALVGSLVDSYGFKESGLVKKTMSVTVAGVTHHLVSYYSVDDVTRGALAPPTRFDGFRQLRPRTELVSKQNFRSPIDELDPPGPIDNPNDPASYSYRTQMLATASYPLQGAQGGFYMQETYIPATHPGPALSGYSVQNPHSYLPTPTAAPAQLPHVPKQEEYSQYRQHSYGTAFDTMSQGSLSSAIQPSIPGSLASSISERARSQSDQSQAAYRNSSISSRSMTTDTTSPIDPSTPATFSQRSSFSLAGQLDPSSHSPLDHRNMSFDATVPRRESNPVATNYYTRSEQPPHHPYYLSATAPATHPGYPVSAAWSTAPAQPQI
ncbi:Gti1/Pac2 family-domain-containing protein [Aspergillus germanicus]